LYMADKCEELDINMSLVLPISGSENKITISFILFMTDLC